MAAPTSTNEVTARKFSSSISALWTKIKSTFQTLGNLVTTLTGWSGTPSDTKYPSEKLVKTSLDAKVSAREEQVATVQDLIQSVRVKPGGSVGSAYLTSASTVSGFSIPSAWYNYIWVPHRDGSASSDNQKYGTLILTPLTNTPNVYVIEGGALAGSSPTYKAIKLANNTDARTISQDVSKGANLVVNGSGRMASGYNFSGFLYIPSISNGGSAGSFGFVGTTPIDEFISCDFNKKIVFSADIKNLVAQPSNCVHRIYVAEYDIDKNIINAAHVMFGVGTLTELTQDLNTGDTVVHLADLSGSNWIATEAYQRGFIFWNYKNSYNYLYPPETYSRNVYIGSNNTALYENANVNVSAGTITLNNAWAGPKIVAGTKVSRRQAGNVYPYPAQANISDTNWHTIQGALKGIAIPGTSERGAKFSQGTAFIKVGVYPTNASNTDETTGKKAVVTNFFVYEEQDINDAIGTLPVANGGTGKTSVTAGNYLVGNGTSALTEKTPNVAANDLINALSTGESTPTGEDYYVAQYAGGGTTTKTYHRRPVKALWEYIKSQISSVLGLTATSYGGNAATATKATQDSDGNAINATYFKSSGNTTLVAGAATKIGTQNGADVKLTLPAHQDISGKMNTSASNATAPSSSGGDGATATLLNNLTDGNSDIATTDNGDNVLIATTDNGGTVTNKWYKRKLVKLIPWIIKKLGTRLVYDCGAGSTSGDDFDAALAAFNAGQWVIIRKDGIAYYCVGSYSGPGLRFKQIANDGSLLKVNTISWTRGSSPSAVAQIEASLSGHTHTRSDVTNFAHTHGNIQDSGALQTNDVTIASGDKLVITDSSDSSKVARASASFDGSTTTKALTQKGTFETFMTPSAGNAASGALQNLTGQLTEGTSDFTDNTEIFTSYAGNNGFAESGHVNQPYRRKASSMLNYVRDWFAIARNPAGVGTSHKRISLGYGKYNSSAVGAATYLVHLFFNYVDDGGLQGKGITVLVTYDFRRSSLQKAECRILSDNGVRDAGYNVVLANYVSGSGDNSKLYICIGLVKNSAPTTLVEFAYSYCEIFKLCTIGDWTQDISSDAVGTYNYLIQATDLVSAAVNADMVDGKHIVIGSWDGASNTIYFG